MLSEEQLVAMLGFRNTHLPLKHRVRAALEEEARQEACAASLAQATPEQLHEVRAALSRQQHLQRNRERYAERVAALPAAGPQHLSCLASLGAQLQKAQRLTEDAFKAVCGSVQPREITDEEVERIVQKYLASRKKGT
ncbi:MAG TPA: hypothetical protein VFA26_00080 [Gemmataceae bacterium]|jgi:alcohol dehydrogenase class IV|nr:hypothetical protein [Gemmataceae bacterium]